MTSLCTVADKRRVSAVTKGLPSRSPPIHIPIVIGFGLFKFKPLSAANFLYSEVNLAIA